MSCEPLSVINSSGMYGDQTVTRSGLLHCGTMSSARAQFQNNLSGNLSHLIQTDLPPALNQGHLKIACCLNGSLLPSPPPVHWRNFILSVIKLE